MKCSTRVVTLALLSCAALICAPSAHAAESTNQYLQFTNPSDASIPYSGGAVAVSVKNGTLLRNCLVRTTVHLEGFPCSSSRLNTMWIPASNSPNATTVKITLTGKRGAKNVMENLDLTVSGMPRDLYVALGDSFSSGEGNVENGWLNNNGTSDWTGVAFPLEIPKAGTRVQRATTTGCNRSSVSFPLVTYQALKVSNPDLGFADYACSGATSTDLTLDSQAVSAGASKASGNHDEPRQLENESALRAAKYVSLTIGGNDLGFADVIKECVLLLFCAKKSGNNFTNSALAKAMKLTKDMGPILDATYTKLKTVAPTAKVFVLDYPNLLPTKPNSSCGFFWKDEVTALQQLQSQLHASVKKAVAKAGFIYVDPNTNSSADPLKNTSFEGHSICESADKRWFHEVSVANVATTATGNSGRTAHPNPMGQRAMADALLAAIQLDQSASGSTDTNRFVQLVSGTHHTCGVLTSGKVKCWGSNSYGELGFGYRSERQELPALVPNLTGVTSLGLGEGFSCALLVTSTVKCWGYNVNGQLGLGHNRGDWDGSLDAYTPIPSLVQNLTGVTSLAVGAWASCATLNTGEVKCWGFNSEDGLLGVDSKSRNINIPTTVPGLTGVVRVTIGWGHQCALLITSEVKCWGSNYAGQLGLGFLSNTGSIGVSNPTLVPNLSGVTSLALGHSFSCATLKSSEVKCWGSNEHGQLGLGFLGNTGLTGISNPTLVPNLSSVASLASGYAHSCVILNTRNVKCWGVNDFGELGFGYQSRSYPWGVPSASFVSGLSDVKSLVLGGFFSYASLNTGDVYFWGVDPESLGFSNDYLSAPTLVPGITFTTSPANT